MTTPSQDAGRDLKGEPLARPSYSYEKRRKEQAKKKKKDTRKEEKKLRKLAALDSPTEGEGPDDTLPDPPETLPD